MDNEIKITPPVNGQTPNLPDSTDEVEEKKPETFSLGAGEKKQEGGILDRLLKKSPGAGTIAMAGENASKIPDLSEILKTPKQSSGSGSGPSISQLLGPQPLFNKAAFEEAYKKKLKICQNIFYGAILIAIIAFGFFYVQLNPQITILNDLFDKPNIASDFEHSNTEVKLKQTELNIVNYRLIRLLLDDLSLSIDPYVKVVHEMGDKDLSDENRATWTSLADAQVVQIRQRLKELQKYYRMPLSISLVERKVMTSEEVETQFHDLLKQQLVEQKQLLTQAKEPNPDEIRIVDNLIKLVDNAGLKTKILAARVDNMPHEDVVKLLSEIRAQGTDELSSVQKIKTARLDWARRIQDIHSIVRQADDLYGQGLFKDVGGFLFSSYRFDATTGRISISGVTKTANNKTFSYITKLIDAIEKSTEFKDIDFRSFTKTVEEQKDGRKTYSSGVNLEFAIQTGPDPRDEQVK